MSAEPEKQPEKPQSLLDTVNSVSAAFFGVQSQKNRERDFKRGKASHFIAVGIAMTLVFVFIVWMAVKFALKSAGV